MTNRAGPKGHLARREGMNNAIATWGVAAILVLAGTAGCFESDDGAPSVGMGFSKGYAGTRAE